MRTSPGMYKRRTPGAKRDPIKQWALPDRVFFAAGACHMLDMPSSRPTPAPASSRIRPGVGHTGNHIALVRNEFVFDYHGFSVWSRYWAHTMRRANQWWPGWSADIVRIRRDALVSRRQAREYEGLWMKEPQEFLFDPLTRVRRYLERFPGPPVVSARAE
jgi:hypothetical protein